jgi:hypothetical protein
MRLNWRLMVLLATAAGLELFTSTVARAQNPAYGIVSDNCEDSAALGIGSLRVTMYWSVAQPNQGDSINYYLDGLIGCLNSHGVKVLLTLEDAPSWASGVGGSNYGYPNQTYWSNYVASVIARYVGIYGTDVVTFGIWNEPDGHPFGAFSVSQYSTMFNNASAARDSVNGNARLLFCECNPDHGWFQSVYSSSRSSMHPQDVVGVHGYFNSSNVFDVQGFMGWYDGQTEGHELWLSETATTGDLADNVDDVSEFERVILDRFCSTCNQDWKRIFFYRNTGDAEIINYRDQFGNRRPVWSMYQSYIYWANGGGCCTEYSITLQSVNGYYLAAEGNGGGDIHANRTGIGPWETWVMVDENGGSLEDGDVVRFHTTDGWKVVATWNGPLQANYNGSTTVAEEEFQVRVTDGGGLGNGAHISLQSLWSGYYGCAENGGDATGDVNVNRTAVGPWETFTLIIH